MAGPDARSWELPFDPSILAQLPADLTGGAITTSAAGTEVRRQVLEDLAVIVRTRLTNRQRQIVELCFFDGCTQQEVAERLGISQQAVSRQLHGVVRDGRRIGGAISRLRTIAAEQGWDPEEWV